MSHILIVDDEKNIRRTVEMILQAEGYETSQAENGADAIALIEQKPVDLVFMDLLMPGKNGIETLKEIRTSKPELSVVMMSGHGTIGDAVEAVKLGAYDFIEKPLTKEKIVITARNVLDHTSLKEENKSLRREIAKKFEMVGQSDAMKNIKDTILKIAPTNVRVLILGESGTGKELVARALHDFSIRKNKPFIKVNCAAIPEELIESELFGAVKGAFTGSVADRDGKFTLAHTGTLFLDEIGDMSMKVQAKVLRALQEGEFEKVGGNKTIKVDVRVVAATNKDLKSEVQKGTFREDLYFRLNVVPIVMPPLRERKQDIPSLISHFVRVCSEEAGLTPKPFTDEALSVLSDYDWNGNIRELRNVVERTLVLAPGDRIEADDLPRHLRDRSGLPLPKVTFEDEVKSLKEFRDEMERLYIQHVLQMNKGNITKTASDLSIERTNLHKRLKQLDPEASKEN